MRSCATSTKRLLIAAALPILVAFTSEARAHGLAEDFKLISSLAGVGDEFGRSVAVNNGIIAAGVPSTGSLESRPVHLFDAATRAEIAQLVPDDGLQVNRFGQAVDIGDDIVAVGAPEDDDNGTKSGSAYLFDLVSGAQSAKLLPTDGAEGDEFGYSIAIGSGVVAVGAPQDDDNGSASGAAYLFDASTGLQLAKLLPDDGAEGDEFGHGIAVADGIVVVGAPADDDLGTSSGSAYLFDASTGAQIGKLLADDGGAFQVFGYSVGIDDGVVAVGAILRGDTGGAYLFDAATGQQTATLAPPDPAASFAGWSLAIDAGRVAIGGPLGSEHHSGSGGTYVFDVSTGDPIAQLRASDTSPSHEFGASVAMAGEVLAVGAPSDAEGGNSTGAVYVMDFTLHFEDAQLFHTNPQEQDHFGQSVAIADGVLAVGVPRPNGSGSVVLFDAATLTRIGGFLPSEGSYLDEFGSAVAMADGLVAVGAPLDEENGPDSGSAYVFEATTGEQIAKLLPDDGASGWVFGSSIAIADGVVVVGAPAEFSSAPGAVYLFDATTHEQLAKLQPNDGAVGDRFGTSVALADGIVAVGAPYAGAIGANPGAVYLFDAATHEELAQLVPSDGAEEDSFGVSVAIADGIVAVGAERKDDEGPDAGGAYLFDAVTFAEIARFDNKRRGEGTGGGLLGRSIAMSDGVLAVGAPFDDDAQPLGEDHLSAAIGAVHLFDIATGEPFAKIHPSHGPLYNLMGTSIAMSDGVVAAGAPFNNDRGTNTGAVDVFYVSVSCPADLNGDGSGDLADLALLAGCMAGDSVPAEPACEMADLDGDGDVDLADFAAFQRAYGCP